MEKILEQILEKLTRIDSVQQEQSKKLNSLDNKVSNLDSKVTSMETNQKEMKSDIKLIKTQQSEHGEILQAVRHAQEVQKAQNDKLEVDLAKLSGEQQKSFETLINMYGRHEFEITQLKQVK